MLTIAANELSTSAKDVALSTKSVVKIEWLCCEWEGIKKRARDRITGSLSRQFLDASCCDKLARAVVIF